MEISNFFWIYLAFANNIEDAMLEKLPEEFRNLSSVLSKEDKSASSPIRYEKKYQASIKNLTIDLNDDNHILVFHFAGHTKGENIALSDQVAYTEALASLLGCQTYLKLVVLNGCATERQVRYFHLHGVPAVIATPENIEDELAAIFSNVFYQHLVTHRKSLIEAFNQACDTIKLKKNTIETLIIRDTTSFKNNDTISRWILYINQDIYNVEEVEQWKLDDVNPFTKKIQIDDLPKDYCLLLYPPHLEHDNINNTFINPINESLKKYEFTLLNGYQAWQQKKLNESAFEILWIRSLAICIFIDSDDMNLLKEVLFESIKKLYKPYPKELILISNASFDSIENVKNLYKSVSIELNIINKDPIKEKIALSLHELLTKKDQLINEIETSYNYQRQGAEITQVSVSTKANVFLIEGSEQCGHHILANRIFQYFDVELDGIDFSPVLMNTIRKDDDFMQRLVDRLFSDCHYNFDEDIKNVFFSNLFKYLETSSKGIIFNIVKRANYLDVLRNAEIILADFIVAFKQAIKERKPQNHCFIFIYNCVFDPMISESKFSLEQLITDGKGKYTLEQDMQIFPFPQILPIEDPANLFQGWHNGLRNKKMLTHFAQAKLDAGRDKIIKAMYYQEQIYGICDALAFNTTQPAKKFRTC